MIKLDENEDCRCECHKIERIEGENILDYFERIHNTCERRVNLRGVMTRPCHKLVVLTREWAEQYRYDNKYFMFRG